MSYGRRKKRSDRARTVSVKSGRLRGKRCLKRMGKRREREREHGRKRGRERAWEGERGKALPILRLLHTHLELIVTCR